MMERSTRRISGILFALLVLHAMGGNLQAQTPPLSVRAMAGSASPLPTVIGQPVTVPLSATASNVPTTNSYTCPISPPNWSWTTVNQPPPLLPIVQYAATLNAWGTPPPGSYSLLIAQGDPTSPAAMLTATFQQAGYWRISPVVTLSYNDSPCIDTWQASSQVTISDITAISVQLSPIPAYVGVGGTTALTVTTMPADQTGQLTFTTADPTIATVTGIAPNFTITGVAAGVTQVQALLNGAVIASGDVYVIGVSFVPSPLYCTPGNTVALTATVTPAEAIDQVTFDTVDAATATVAGSAPDLTVMGVATGTTQVRASVDGFVVATVPVNVLTVAVQFSPSPAYLIPNGSATLTVTVSDPSVANQVTFDTADVAIATVSGSASNLTATGVAVGTTQVRAWLGGDVIGASQLEVIGVQFSPAPANVGVGGRHDVDGHRDAWGRL